MRPKSVLRRRPWPSGRFFCLRAHSAPRGARTSRPDHTAVPDKSVYTGSNIALSIGAGLASAVIFVVLTRFTTPAILLAHLAPLPIMVVALGLGVRHGATAAIVGAVGLSIWPAPLFGLIFGIYIALPAFVASYALSGAPWNRHDLVRTNSPGWATLAAAIALIAVTVVGLGVMVARAGSLAEAVNPFQAILFDTLEKMATMEREAGGAAPDSKQLQIAVAHSMQLIPGSLPSHLLIVHMLNLWLAARLCKTSGMLTLPWPDIATQLVLPRWAAVVLGLSLAGTLMLPGYPGAVAFIVFMTLGVAFAMQGLAVLQTLLRGHITSGPILTLIYFVLGVLGWPIVILGVVEAVFLLRARKAATAAVPPPAKPDEPPIR
jgi:hypothetical protein